MLGKPVNETLRRIHTSTAVLLFCQSLPERQNSLQVTSSNMRFVTCTNHYSSIRDLAQNWDVDIASSLEDYLEDLEDITITLDGGASKVNFAEAALLIQVTRVCCA